ncbi:proteinaceous RNase P [Marchantia polymorpha subsp. ruderalis]
MDMLHQLPGALYRLRSARVPPFSSLSGGGGGGVPAKVGPAANRWGIRLFAHSVACSRYPRSEKVVSNGFGLGFRQSLNGDVFGSRYSSGFRVYSGKQGCGDSPDRWNKSVKHRIPCPSVFGNNGRSLLVVAAAARSSNSKAQDDVEVPLRISEKFSEGESEKPFSRPAAHIKRQGKSQSNSSRSARPSQVDSSAADSSSRWRFKPNNNQAGAELPKKNLPGAAKEDSAQAGLRTDVSKAKNSVVRPSTGKAVSVSSGTLHKRVVRSSKRTDILTSNFSTRAGSTSVNAGSKSQYSSITREETGTQTVVVGPSRGTPEIMSIQQRVANGKQAEKERKPKHNERKKEKHFPVEAVLRRDLNMCSKGGDVLRALELYDQSVADGIVKWNQYNFNILLYLCSSASLGTLTARKSGSDRAESERMRFNATEQMRNGEASEFADGGREESTETPVNDEETASASTSIVLSPEIMETVTTRGFEIYEHMKRLKVPPNEATLTAVARLAVARGDGDLAFQMVKEMAALNLAPKLRSYSPALFTYCKNKAVKEAFEVDAHMVAAGVHPEEPELAALLQLCVDTGLADEVYKLLHRLRVKVRALSPITVATVEQWFSNEAALMAGKDSQKPDASSVQQAVVASGGGWHGLGWLGEGKWKQNWTKIDDEGVCLSCKEKLVTIDLDPQETENFAQSLFDLACAREAKPNDFKKFQEWHERHGPFDAIVDGANIGLFNQNFAQGGFNFYQLNAVVTALEDQGLSKRPPLIFLHHARTKFGAATTPQAQQLLNKWRSSNSLYTTPNGSNDDWYWMYAAVKDKCLLVTNDEMRDHLFQLLGTDFFPKWKERHQVRFSCTSRGPQFHLPPPYSIVIQESETGSWHVPKIGGDDLEAPCEWLCVTRPVSESAAPAAPAAGPTSGELSSSAVETLEVSISPEKISSEGVTEEEQKCSLLKNHSLDSGTGEAGVRVKRSRLNPPSETYIRIKGAEKLSENGTIAFEI